MTSIATNFDLTEEQEMIEEILRLGDRPIRVAMTPRHDAGGFELVIVA